MVSPLSQFGTVEALWISGCNFLVIGGSALVYLGIIAFACYSGIITVDNKDIPMFSVYQFLRSAILREISLSYNSRSKLKTPIWTPWYLSIILCVLVSNLYGLVPYSYTFTSSITVVSFLAIALFILVNFLGTVVHGWGILGLFLPSGIPLVMAPLLVIIEIFSYLARVASLTIRLFANMMSGHTLLKVLITLAWSASNFSLLGVFGSSAFILILSVIILLEVAIGFLQAYVFLVLSSLYFGDAVNLH